MPSKQQKSKTPQIDKVDVFCLEYLKHFNATEAWRKTFPESKAKHQHKAACLFRNSEAVEKRLQEIAAEIIPDMKQDVRDIIAETKRIASFNPETIMTIDESGRPVLDLTTAFEDPNIMRMLDIKFSSSVDKEGNVHHTYDLKAHDKMAALEKLYKYYKLYADSQQEQGNRNIQVNVQFPLPGDHWRTGKPVPQEVIDYLDTTQ